MSKKVYGEGFGRCHSTMTDKRDRAESETIAARYREAPRWAGWEIAVLQATNGLWFVAARINPTA
jgi:hypothetical protein